MNNTNNDSGWFFVSVVGLITGMIMWLGEFDFFEESMTLQEAEDVIEYMIYTDGYSKSVFSDTFSKISWTKYISWGLLIVSTGSFFISGALILEERGAINSTINKTFSSKIESWRSLAPMLMIGLIILGFVFKYQIEEIFIEEYSKVL